MLTFCPNCRRNVLALSTLADDDADDCDAGDLVVCCVCGVILVVDGDRSLRILAIADLPACDPDLVMAAMHLSADILTRAAAADLTASAIRRKD
jgi:hypothetical protein